MKTKDQPRFASFFRYWWTVMLLLFCYGFYLHGMHKKKELRSDLVERVEQIEGRLFAAVDQRDDLLLQLESQSDPAWIEMLMKKNLGMVPVGQTKVYFEKE